MSNTKYYFITEAFSLRKTSATRKGRTDALRSCKTVISLADFGLFLIFCLMYHPEYEQQPKPTRSCNSVFFVPKTSETIVKLLWRSLMLEPRIPVKFDEKQYVLSKMTK